MRPATRYTREAKRAIKGSSEPGSPARSRSNRTASSITTLRGPSVARPGRAVVTAASNPQGSRDGRPRPVACPARSAPPDHPLDGRLQHDLVALIEDAVGVGDDPPVALPGLALVRDLDFHADGVALQHRGNDLHRA